MTLRAESPFTAAAIDSQGSSCPCPWPFHLCFCRGLWFGLCLFPCSSCRQALPGPPRSTFHLQSASKKPWKKNHLQTLRYKRSKIMQTCIFQYFSAQNGKCWLRYLKVPQPDSTLYFFRPFILTSVAALVPARKISDKSVSTCLSSLPLFLPFPTLAPLPLDLPLPFDSHFFGAVQTCQMTKNSSGWSLRTEQDCNCPTCLTKNKTTLIHWPVCIFQAHNTCIIWAHIYLHAMYIIWYTDTFNPRKVWTPQ